MTTAPTDIAKPTWLWLTETCSHYIVLDWDGQDPNQPITIEQLQDWLRRAKVLLSTDGWWNRLVDPNATITFYGGYDPTELITYVDFHRRLGSML